MGPCRNMAQVTGTPGIAQKSGILSATRTKIERVSATKKYLSNVWVDLKIMVFINT